MQRDNLNSTLLSDRVACNYCIVLDYYSHCCTCIRSQPRHSETIKQGISLLITASKYAPAVSPQTRYIQGVLRQLGMCLCFIATEINILTLSNLHFWNSNFLGVYFSSHICHRTWSKPARILIIGALRHIITNVCKRLIVLP